MSFIMLLLLSPTRHCSLGFLLTRATQRCSIRLCHAAVTSAVPIDDLLATPVPLAAAHISAGSELRSSELGLFLGASDTAAGGSREPQAAQMQLLPLTWGRR